MTTIKNLLLTLIAGLTIASCAKDPIDPSTPLHEVNARLVQAELALAQEILKVNDLQKEITNLNAQIEADAVTIANLNAEVAILNENINGLENTVSNLNDRVAELEALVVDRDAQIVVLTESNDELNYQVGVLNELNNELNNLVNAQQSEIDDLNAEITAQKSIITELTGQVQELTDIVNQYEVEIVEIETTLQEEIDNTNEGLELLKAFVIDTIMNYFAPEWTGNDPEALAAYRANLEQNLPIEASIDIFNGAFGAYNISIDGLLGQKDTTIDNLNDTIDDLRNTINTPGVQEVLDAHEATLVAAAQAEADRLAQIAADEAAEAQRLADEAAAAASAWGVDFFDTASEIRFQLTGENRVDASQYTNYTYAYTKDGKAGTINVIVRDSGDIIYVFGSDLNRTNGDSFDTFKANN